jgi:hypothetical protein
VDKFIITVDNFRTTVENSVANTRQPHTMIHNFVATIGNFSAVVGNFIITKDIFTTLVIKKIAVATLAMTCRNFRDNEIID